MTECVRRPTSTYTMCACEDCLADQRRKKKLLRSGIAPVADRREAAWRRLERWIARGYTAGAIAALTGHSPPATRRLVASLRAGKKPRMTHEAARRIVTAPDRPVDTRGRIPATGTNRRLRALTAMGWTLMAMSDRSGLTHQTLSDLRGTAHPMTTPKFAEAVRRLYDELSMTPGASEVARKSAARRGWHGPLAWDDDTIDDADAVADVGAGPNKSHGGGGRPTEETVEDVEWLLEQHPLLTCSEIAVRLGYADSTGVQNALKHDRGNRPDLLAQLARNAEVAA